MQTGKGMKNHPGTYDLLPIDLKDKPVTPDAEIPSFSVTPGKLTVLQEQATDRGQTIKTPGPTRQYRDVL